ncbi:MAG: ankyrin repeat domain-containing protein [Elusimicrobia bacterium]|nr:ankyrin repeat domain-containing protein [Elusimicrobiota bacterium]
MKLTALAVAALVLGAAACAVAPAAPGASPVRPLRERDVVPLVSAAAAGDLGRVRQLLAGGADANAHDKTGRSPLGAACMYGRAAVAEALLDAGARFDAPEKDQYGSMPVLLAVFNGHPETARVLVNRGARLDAKANGGQSALARAIGTGRLDRVQDALALGADPNEADENGQTPVTYATFANRPDMVKAMTAAGGAPVGVQGRVGLALAADAKGAVYAREVVAGSPAAAAGLQKDDRIVSIDGAPAERLTLAQAVARLRGAPGAPVAVGVVRGDAAPVVFTVVRESVGVAASAQAPRPAGAAPPPPAPPQAASSDIDAPARRGAERPDDFALVIGIEEYQSLPRADYGVRDAQTVRTQATKGKLQSYLQEWLPRNVKPDSTVFVYYSGHGAPEPAWGDAYLVPWDGDPMFLATTGLSLKQFYADLAKLKVKRVVVALDACFSGAGGRSVLAKGARPLVVKVNEAVPASERLTVLAAASGSEITGSLADQGHGLFTYYFLKGLSGAAKNASGEVTPKSLYDYLKPRVQDEARRQNREQTPTLAGASGDQPLD